MGRKRNNKAFCGGKAKSFRGGWGVELIVKKESKGQERGGIGRFYAGGKRGLTAKPNRKVKNKRERLGILIW